MDFREVIENNNEKYIVDIGYNGRKEIKSIDLKENPSIIITGETGSGKSILIDQIVCQLIKNNTSLDMDFVLIDSSGVELNLYADSRYSKEYALRDNDKGIELLSKVLRMAEEREVLLTKEDCDTIDDYNEKYPDDKLSDIVLVIDDNNELVSSEDFSKQITALINFLGRTGVYLVAAFSNTDNYFFKSNKNLYSSVLITFDMSDAEHANYVNFPGAEDLTVGRFMLKERTEEKYKEFNNFDFDDKIIVDILNK